MERDKEVFNIINSIVIPEDLRDLDIPVIPLRDKVIIKKVDSQRVTKAGLIIAETNKSNRPLGRILAVGPNCSHNLKKGLLVVFDPMFDFPLVIDGMDYIMLNEPFIDAVIADEKRVHVPLEPLTGADIKRAEKMDNVKRVRKLNEVKYENHMDEYNEKAKDRQKNPTISKYKRK